jgi:hypothetical protein
LSIGLNSKVGDIIGLETLNIKIMKTKQWKEKHLNELFTDSFSEEQAVDHFIYLTSKQRGERTTEAYIRKCHRNRELGTLLRRLDPIAFNVC